MAKYHYVCEKCGIEFDSYKELKNAKLCNMCSTNKPATKIAICEKCGKEFVLHRNPKDGNKFEKKKLCPDCSGWHCDKCGKLITTKEEISHRLCNSCYNHTQEYFLKSNDDKHYSYCIKCGREIIVESDKKNHRRRLFEL